MSEVINSSNFDEKVLKSDKPVLVDFFATWCGPCKMIAPFVDEVAQENLGKAEVYKVDIDQSPDLAAQYGVSGVPTLITFQNGQVKNKNVGAVPKQKIADMLA